MENKDYKDQVKLNLLDDENYFQYLQEKYMKIVKITKRNKLKSSLHINDDETSSRGNSVLDEKVPKFKNSSMLLNMSRMSKPKGKELTSKFRPMQSGFRK